MTNELPPSGAGRFATRFPDVWRAYQALGASAAASGPIDTRGRRLVKLAMAIGAGSEGAVHSHARQALEEGVSAEEIRQVCNLSITTLGFPTAMAALSWVNDVIGNNAKEGEGR
jgi:alkylhydroperoxidase/carboxymuconolactone decarboxylase family protein YurZ